MRGGACGVAVISKSVCRPCPWQNEEPDLVKAARMMRCMVRITVQVVVIYGACSGAGKQQINEQLLSDAWMWVKSYQGFSIVAGDFNVPPQSLQSFALFQQAGFHEFFEYYELSPSVTHRVWHAMLTQASCSLHTCSFGQTCWPWRTGSARQTDLPCPDASAPEAKQSQADQACVGVYFDCVQHVQRALQLQASASHGHALLNSGHFEGSSIQYDDMGPRNPGKALQ